MNRLFDDTLRGFGPPRFAGAFGGDWNGPSLEVSDHENEVRITAELPGLEQKDIELAIADDVLTLSGEKRAEIDDKDRRYSERSYGRF
jgi:HSP20 family protein